MKIAKHIFFTGLIVLCAPMLVFASFEQDFNSYCKDLEKDLRASVKRADGPIILRRAESLQVSKTASQYIALLPSASKSSSVYAEQRRVSRVRNGLVIFRDIWFEKSRSNSDRSQSENFEFGLRASSGDLDKQLKAAWEDIDDACWP